MECSVLIYDDWLRVQISSYLRSVPARTNDMCYSKSYYSYPRNWILITQRTSTNSTDRIYVAP